MIKIYGMSSCPDCTYVWEQAKGNPTYEIIDFGHHVSDLKAFLRLRDHNRVFDEARARGAAGIPWLSARPVQGQACSLDGTGC